LPPSKFSSFRLKPAVHCSVLGPLLFSVYISPISHQFTLRYSASASHGLVINMTIILVSQTRQIQVVSRKCDVRRRCIHNSQVSHELVLRVIWVVVSALLSAGTKLSSLWGTLKSYFIFTSNRCDEDVCVVDNNRVAAAAGSHAITT